MALTFLSLVMNPNNEPEYSEDGTEVLCKVMDPDESMTYAFVDIEELKLKGISLSTVSSAKSYKKQKACYEKSRESSDDDQTYWNPQKSDHSVKAKKSLFDSLDESISSHDEESHSIHNIDSKQEIAQENSEIVWTSILTKALISERIECDPLFQRPSCKKIKLWRSIALKINSAFENKINLTDKLCDRKWRNLWQTYKANVKKSNSTGTDSIIWEYYNDFNEHFGTKDNINPPATNLKGSFTLASTSKHNSSPAKDILSSKLPVTSKSPLKPSPKKKSMSKKRSYGMDAYIDLKREEMVKMEEHQKRLLTIRETEAKALSDIASALKCLADKS